MPSTCLRRDAMSKRSTRQAGSSAGGGDSDEPADDRGGAEHPISSLIELELDADGRGGVVETAVRAVVAGKRLPEVVRPVRVLGLAGHRAVVGVPRQVPVA